MTLSFLATLALIGYSVQNSEGSGKKVRGPVHISPEQFDNAVTFLRLAPPSTLIRHEKAALFLWLGLPSTLIRHENAAFYKRPSNWRNLTTELFENDAITIIT